MSKDSNNLTLAVSRKVYGRLLLAYPKPHREKYGAAMAQLFRDQCRDEWNRARGPGLTKLWLRVLPDLLSTSVRERIAALKERKTVNDKIASLSNDRTTPAAIFFRVSITMFLLAVIAAMLITYITPKGYCSEAQLLIKSSSEKLQTKNVAFDPHMVRSELEILESDQVLGAAIMNLALGAEWGKRYAAGRILNSDETIKMLRQRIIINNREQSPIIDIHVYDEIPDEARGIAEAIIMSYLNYSLEHNYSEPQMSRVFAINNVIEIEAPTPPYLVRPIISVNICRGILAGVLLGIVAGSASAFYSMKFGKRSRKNARLA